ncbi:MAG TPA: ATP-binding protein [Candidatus Megaira endosymbiont of Nemacystus decipiens]|nr:ATP-binding protein [Candidatus Megaera endosymbiont of Nemacystus decipiens]
MIDRQFYISKIEDLFEVNSVCGILGPRQCGKTTLAKAYAKKYSSEINIHYFDLEDPESLASLDNPKLTLEPLEGLIIIDEIQRRAELFSYLRVLVDKYPDRQILVLGSASKDLINQSSETLAGRISYVELTPFSLSEAGDIKKLWQRGGFPKSFLASKEEISIRWRKEFIATFLERDLRSMGIDVSSYDMRKLWTMIAHYHGNSVNYSELGRSLSLSDKTIRKYIHLLQGTFMVRLLKPWFANVKKRQVKIPKIYIRDSGILHSLLGIRSETLVMNPKVGASWEGFAMEEVIKKLEADYEDCYYWGVNNQSELDLLVVKYGKKHAFEFKYTDSPKVTKSMYTSINDLELEKITIVVPGNNKFFLEENIIVCGIEAL